MGNLNFDATNIAPSQAFEPLPNGWYQMRIVECDVVASESAGDMVKIKLEIDDQKHPEFHNRCAFTNLCINHPNQMPREIANRSLSAIAHAVGIIQIADTDQLLGATLQVKLKAVPVTTDKTTGKTYDAKNEVSGYKAIDDGAGPATQATTGAGPAATTAAAKPAGAAVKPSWKR